MNLFKTVPARTTTFAGYNPPRMTKSTALTVQMNSIDDPQLNEICSVCHNRLGLHNTEDKCPEYQVLIARDIPLNK